MVYGDFNNISVLLWWSVLLVEETRENQRPALSHWQTLSHNGFNLTTLVVIGDCTGRCKSNYHTITPTTAPSNTGKPLTWQYIVKKVGFPFSDFETTDCDICCFSFDLIKDSSTQYSHHRFVIYILPVLDYSCGMVACYNKSSGVYFGYAHDDFHHSRVIPL
jgi:hypothetical protein